MCFPHKSVKYVIYLKKTKTKYYSVHKNVYSNKGVCIEG